MTRKVTFFCILCVQQYEVTGYGQLCNLRPTPRTQVHIYTFFLKKTKPRATPRVKPVMFFFFFKVNGIT